MNANVTLTGAVDDARGLGVTVHQDHNGVRIDAGGIEITFELGKIGSLQAFMRLLADAACDSRLWEIGQSADMGALVCAACGKPVELTFDDEYQHDTTDAELACREYPILPARPAGYYLERGN